MKPIITEFSVSIEKPKTNNPIKLVSILGNDLEKISNPDIDLPDEKFITLICKNYTEDGMDLFLIHSAKNPSIDPESTVLCIGHWNDGVIE